VHTNREKYMSYNNLKRICVSLKAIKWLKVIKRLKGLSLRLCLVTRQQAKVIMGKNLIADKTWQVLS
jgi:hypothetical protein